MRVLVLGLGSIGSRHARLVASLGHEVLAFDPRPRKLDGIESVSTPEEGLKRADAAIVATPSDDHYASARQCLDAAVPALVEKPLALTLDDARDLAARSEQARLWLGVGMNLRFHPGVRALRSILRERTIGRPLRCSIWCGSWLPGWRPGADYRDAYSAHAEQGGGVLLDAIHEIDYLLWLLGSVRRVSALLAHVSPLETDTEDVALLTAELAGGTVAQIGIDYFDQAYHRGCRIVGSEGSVEWSWERGRVEVFAERGASPEVLRTECDADAMYRAELSDFLEAIETGRGPATGASEGADALAVVEAARESARTGRAVDVQPAIVLRPARATDREAILRWRNDQASRAASRNTSPIGGEEHERWLRTRLADERTNLLVAELDGQAIGQVRLERLRPGSLEVSITLEPAVRGRGWARKLLEQAIEAAGSVADATVLVAHIRPENEASRRAFEATGFRRTRGEEDGFEQFQLELVGRLDVPKIDA